MKRIKDIIREEIKFLKRNRSSLYENENLSGRNIICVDIQPEYKDGIHFDLYEWIEYLNELNTNNNITFLYNGADTLGMISEYDYKDWLINDLGGNEELIMDSNFYDKGYAFFRYCIDSGIDDENVANLVKFMMANNINDSRDLTEDIWNSYIEQYGDDDIRELLEYADDMINIPDLVDYLKNLNNIVLMGGGMNECLKEVEIALMAMDKPYSPLNRFIY